MENSKHHNACQNASISRKTARDRWQAFRDSVDSSGEITSTQTEPTLETYPKITRSNLVAAVDGLAHSRGGPYTGLRAVLAKGDEDGQASVPLEHLLTNRWCVKEFIHTVAHKVAPSSVIFPNELTNELHPLLSRPHWHNTTDWTWKQLQPVLTLVSKFLTTRTTWDWFTHVATGEVKSQPGTAHRYVGPPQKPLTEAEKYQAVQTIFAQMEKVVKFVVDETKGRFGQAGSVAAIHLGSRDMHDPPQSDIIIEKDLLMAMAKLRVQPSRAEDCNIQTFRIAVTLLHEISHAFNWASLRFAAKLDGTTQEPAFHCHGPLNVVRECGIVYEQLTFGYPLSFKWLEASATPDARPPNLAVFEISENTLRTMYPDNVGNAPDSSEEEPSVMFPPSSWVQEWFLEGTWQRIEREGLGFMKNEARSSKLGYKPNYPIANWGTAYVVVPGDKDVHTICFPTAEPLASGPDCSVRLQIPVG